MNGYILTFDCPGRGSWMFSDLPLGRDIDSRYDLDGLSLIDRAALAAMCRELLKAIEDVEP